MDLLRSIAILYGFSPKDLFQTPWEQGRLACHADMDMQENPFAEQTVPHLEWEKGYLHAKQLEVCYG